MMSKIVLWLAAVSFLGFGVGCLFFPGPVLGSMGLVIGADPWTTELRAFYGGIEIGLGLLLVRCALAPTWREFGLWLVVAAYGGIGIARLIGMAIDEQSGSTILGALGFELGIAILAMIALKVRS